MISISNDSNWLESQAAVNGSLKALTYDNSSYTYSDLSNITSLYSNYLAGESVASDIRAIILTESPFNFLISLFSLWRIGAVPIPLNNSITEEECVEIAGKSGAAYIITDRKQSLNLRKQNLKVIYLTRKGKPAGVRVKTEPSHKEDASAVIIYTSGSSGKAKGVELTFGSLYNSAKGCDSISEFTPGDKFLASLPLHHIGGFSIVCRSLLAGGQLIVPRLSKSGGIMEAVKRYEPQFISLVSTTLFRILKSKLEPYPALKAAFVGGGPTDAELILSAVGKGWPVVNVYGSTETSSMISALKGPELAGSPASSGKPFPGSIVKIVDKDLNEMPVGDTGEIIVKSLSVAKCYVNDPGLNKKRFRDGYYLTGDLGYIDSSGNLFVLGRSDDILISGGIKISRVEVERLLLDTEGVIDAAVLGEVDREWGEKLVAAVVIDSAKLSREEFENNLKATLPGYKTPKNIYYLDSIPRDELSKIRRNELMKIISEHEDRV